MAGKSAKKIKGDKEGERTVCQNRRALHDYSIEERFEAGMVLEGSEVKSLRNGQAQLKDAYGVVERGEIFLLGIHITPYAMSSAYVPPAERRRKLLLKRNEIARIAQRIRERGQTLIPLRIYFKGHLAKVEIALVRGKAQYDRRDAIRRQDQEREADRVFVTRYKHLRNDG